MRVLPDFEITFRRDNIRELYICDGDDFLHFATREEYINMCALSRHMKDRASLNTVFASIAFSEDNDQPTEALTIPTVKENASLYQRREVAQATKAKRLMRYLGYPSETDLIRLLSEGGILNCDVTANDVRLARKIFGPDIASLKGKQVAIHPQPHVSEESPHRRLVRKQQTLHADVMSVDRVLFLASVSQPLGLVSTTHIANKTKRTLLNALRSQIEEYRKRGFDVTTIVTDNDPALRECSSDLAATGVHMEQVGTAQHAAYIERKIRQIKERVRAHTSTLPYNLNPWLLKNLVLFCTYRINCFPNNTNINRISPREAFTGRKLDAIRDVRDVGFGEYVQVHARDDPVTKNSLQPRTWGGITLFPTTATDRAYVIWKLTTNRVLRCVNFTRCPMPKEVIKHLDAIAANTRTILKEPSVTRNGLHIGDDDDTGEGDDFLHPLRSQQDLVY
jgi:hypothetical protein